MWAERLPAYDGVVRAALLARNPPAESGAGVPQRLASPSVDDPALLASLTQNSQGFPGIEYVGRG